MSNSTRAPASSAAMARAMVLAQFPIYAKDYLHGNQLVFMLLLTVFSVGVGMW